MKGVCGRPTHRQGVILKWTEKQDFFGSEHGLLAVFCEHDNSLRFLEARNQFLHGVTPFQRSPYIILNHLDEQNHSIDVVCFPGHRRQCGMVRTCQVRGLWIRTVMRGTPLALIKQALPRHCSRINYWIKSDSPATTGLQSCALKLQASSPEGGDVGMLMKIENFQKWTTKQSWKISCLIREGSECVTSFLFSFHFNILLKMGKNKLHAICKYCKSNLYVLKMHLSVTKSSARL